MTNICSSCEAVNRDTARFCSACGQPMRPAFFNTPNWPSEETVRDYLTTASTAVEPAKNQISLPSQPKPQDKEEPIPWQPEPLPPPFALPRHDQLAINPSSRRDRDPDTHNVKLLLHTRGPIIALAVMGVAALVATTVWLWPTQDTVPSTAEVKPKKVIAATKIQTPIAISPSAGVVPVAPQEPQTPTNKDAPAAISSIPAEKPSTPSATRQPLPKVDAGAPVAKLSFPALPAQATTSPPAAVTTPPPPSPTPELVISTAPASPRDACANKSGANQTTCMEQQCDKSTMREHVLCQRFRKDRAQEFERLYGGS